MTKSTWYSVLVPIVSTIFVIAMFLLDWNSVAVIVGSLLVAAVVMLGQVVPKDRAA